MSISQKSPETIEEYEFKPKLDPRWALNLEQVGVVAAFGLLFFFFNLIPIRGTDIWGHVGYGQWILTNGGLPQADPWMPLAQGMQVVDSAWLSQVIFAGVDQFLGPESLSHLFALVNLITYIIWARIFYVQTRRLSLSLLAMALLMFVGWSRIATIRPENFAMLCFALLAWLLVSARQSSSSSVHDESESAQAASFTWATWLGVPAIFALWANLHGSFFCGLAMLGCFLLGRAIEVLWRSKSLVELVRDGEFRRWIVLTEIAVLATLLNPYGLDLLIYTVKFSGNANLRSVFEWQPLVILGTGGRAFALSIVLLLVVWRQSQRAIRPVEVLLLAVFGLAAVSGVRMLGWYAPMFVIAIAPHLAEIAGRWWPARAPAVIEEAQPQPGEYVLPPGHSFRYSLVALLIIWIAFALSPISQVIFNKSRVRDVPAKFFHESPYELTVYLNSEKVDAEITRAMNSGIVFHRQEWGDWLKLRGPENFKPFVTTNIHLVPPQVWRDYWRVMNLSGSWDRILSRYDVNMIVIDKENQRTLLGALNRNSDWSRRYEDDTAAVFVRNRRQPGQSRADSVVKKDDNIQEG